MTFNINLFNYFVYNQFGGKKNNDAKWTTFSHNGVLFPEPYIPHKIPLLYDGKRINLDAESEEYATIYSKFLDTEYVKSKHFNNNFFKDWKKIIKKSYKTMFENNNNNDNNDKNNNNDNHNKHNNNNDNHNKNNNNDNHDKNNKNNKK